MRRITKEDFVNRRIEELEKEIKKVTSKSYDYRLVPSLGTAGFGVLALVLNVAIPGKALASLGMAGGCFLWNSYLKGATQQKLSALQKEKSHLENLKTKEVTNSPTLNQKRKKKIRSLEKKTKKLKEKNRNINCFLGFTGICAGVTTVLTVANPIFALGTAAGLLVGGILKGKKSKNNNDLLLNNVRVANLKNDLKVIDLSSRPTLATPPRAVGNTGLIKTPMSKTQEKKIDPKQEKLVDKYLNSLEQTNNNYHAKQKVKK